MLHGMLAPGGAVAKITGFEGRMNEQVRRNKARFPADFLFQLSSDEAQSLRSQIATLDVSRVAGTQRQFEQVFEAILGLMAASGRRQ